MSIKEVRARMGHVPPVGAPVVRNLVADVTPRLREQIARLDAEVIRQRAELAGYRVMERELRATIAAQNIELAALRPVKAPAGPTIEQIMVEVSTARDVPIQDMVGPRRARAFVDARFECIWRLAYEIEPRLSLPHIGRIMGHRDHTTILHALERVRAGRARGTFKILSTKKQEETSCG